MKLAVVVLAGLLAAPQDPAWRSDFKATLKEAAGSKKLVVLVFQTKDRRNCLRFQNETLADPGVAAALSRYLCVRIDPDGTDDDNRLWQEQGSPMPPATVVLEPDGKRLSLVTALNPKYFGPTLNDIQPAYFQKLVPAREALAKDPSRTESLVAMAEAYVVFNDADESAKRYGEAVQGLEGKGDKAGALKVLGGQLETYFANKWYRQARRCCAKIAELDPSNATKLRPRAAWVNGMGAIQERQFDEAIAGLREAIEKYPDCGFVEQIMFSLGGAYKEKGDVDNALVWWDSIVIKHPDTETAKTAETVAANLREQIRKKSEGQ